MLLELVANWRHFLGYPALYFCNRNMLLMHLIYYIYINQDESGLCNDLGFLAHLPELCDITFMVGPEKEPVCAVRAVLGNLYFYVNHF